MKEPERIIVICKRDVIIQFWKITLKDNQKYPSKELMDKIIRMMVNRSRREENNFKLYDPDAYFEVWDRNDYREIDRRDVLNVEGKNWPKEFKEVSLFPMANIKTTADLMQYNRWRKTTFKHYIDQLQNDYVWCRKDGKDVDKSYYEDWMNLDPEYVHTINPPELYDFLPENFKRYLNRKLSNG